MTFRRDYKGTSGLHGYAAKRIAALDGYDLRFADPFFKEFVVRSRRDVSTVLDHCRKNNILAGVPLATTHADLSDCFLVAVTENRTKAQIDTLTDALASA